jgi:hypothetical protein
VTERLPPAGWANDEGAQRLLDQEFALDEAFARATRRVIRCNLACMVVLFAWAVALHLLG